jgi:hypothetical protein
MRERRREHDDVHRPLGGKDKRSMPTHRGLRLPVLAASVHGSARNRTGFAERREGMTSMSKAKRPTPRPVVRGGPTQGGRRSPLTIEWVNGEFIYPAPERMRAALGVTSDEFAGTCLAWLLVTQEHPGMPPDALARKASGALAAIEALRPRNEAEAMLAVQMVATQDLAMEALANARRQAAEPQPQHAASLALGLLKVSALQVEALATLRRLK